jgi:hypothetical protein
MSLLNISNEHNIFEYIMFHKEKMNIIRRANTMELSDKDFQYELFQWLEKNKYDSTYNLYSVDYYKIRLKLQHIY